MTTNSQLYKKANLSCGAGRGSVPRLWLLKYTPEETIQTTGKQWTVRVPIPHYETMLFAHRTLKRSSLQYLLVEIKRSMEQPHNSDSPSLQSFEPSMTTSPALSTTTTWAWVTESHIEWKLRAFRTVCWGLMEPWAPLLRYPKPKEKPKNAPKKRSLLNALCLQDKSSRFARYVIKQVPDLFWAQLRPLKTSL